MSVIAAPHTFSTTNSQDIGILPTVSELTIAQAAEIIDMSEACVNSWLNLGRIAFRLENGERLIQLDDLLEFERDWKRRLAAADELFSMFREMGLSDD